MSARNPALAYQDHAIQTADGPHLLIMICERLTADIDRAEVAIETADYEAANENLQHAQRCVRVLRNALDPDGFKGGSELLSVYAFLEQRLVEANLKKDIVLVRQCGETFRPIHEAWQKAVSLNEHNDLIAHVG
ncbi:MAG TPA: flagellar export chaperone FliS [Acidimicrobiales bacterium]|nr:flagellar export chaperone FliS [Acidimicrobiales bacterium]